MRWWIRVRVLAPFLTAVSLVAIWAAVGPDASVVLPNLLAQVSVSVPAAWLLPLVPAILWCWSEERAALTGEHTAVRAVDRYIASLLAAVIGLVALGGVLGLVLNSSGDGLAAARNLTGYLGLALLLSRVVGTRPAGAMVGFFPVFCALFGSGSDGPFWWAWPINAPGRPVAALIAVGLFAAGLAVLARSPAPRPAR
ncbi:hypothetical protein [Streptomyces otsuchiensis]|uniref:hypothetical protein n=1 Tax=Streptomyces otsuchiensis TaxID=2681388 RepID=UPI00103142F1|nr:hypothetical protein [Streptomyces otsuchiensis]